MRDWARLATEVDAEARRLGLSGRALAKRCGISERTVYAVLNVEQESYAPDTIARLESGLWWEPGSVDRVLAGRRPQRKKDPEFARIEHAWRDLSPEARRMLAEVAEAQVRST